MKTATRTTYRISSHGNQILAYLHGQTGSRTALLRQIRAAYPGCIAVTCGSILTPEVCVYRDRSDARRGATGQGCDLEIAAVLPVAADQE